MEKWLLREKENFGNQGRKYLKRERIEILLKDAHRSGKLRTKVIIRFCNLEIIVTLDQHSAEAKTLPERG